MSKAKIKKIAALSFVGLILVILYMPLLVLFVYSFTESRTIGKWNGFSFGLYAQMFTDSEVMSAVGNTLLIGFVSAGLATLIGTISAVGIYYLKKLPKNIISTINQITVINADIVTGVAFMLFFVSIRFIPQGYLTLIITHTVITIPYVILSVLPRLGQLNPNVYEAGLDLGAGPMRTLFTVVVPQLVPAMVAGFALSFTISLDDFVITKFNNGGTVNTISTYIYSKLAKGGLKPVIRAVSSLILIVSFAVLILVNINAKRKRTANKK